VAISYRTADTFPGWGASGLFLASLIDQYGCKQVLEIGSGANPTLKPEDVLSRCISYVTSDVDAEEMEKADATFERLVLDLSSDGVSPSLVGRFDCVFSRMVGEHVTDGELFHKNIHTLLRPGGISVHCLSTLWCLPFAANRLLPEFLSDYLLMLFLPRDRHKHGKFPASYSWSRGPSKKMIGRFESLGFEILDYTGFFGHPYYTRIPWLHRAETLKANLLAKLPIPMLCSYATIVLRKR
jgi:2-polyprenyl-3-methyl-5-hydroxy-6-metoxy-1,4-benzoquinol methylase